MDKWGITLTDQVYHQTKYLMGSFGNYLKLSYLSRGAL